MTVILVVEDEPRVASFITQGLEAAGYATKTAGTAHDALRVALSETPIDVILLDVGLPDRDGFGVLADIRAVNQSVRIIMLTARGDVPSRVKGLDLGADDYLPKPFDFDELLARVRAQLRGTRQPEAVALTAGGIELDLLTRRVRQGGREVDLSTREFSLLEFFMRHPGQVLSRPQLLNGVWGYDFDPGSNVVDVYVGYLRAKLDEAPGPSVIQTVRGGGYRFAPAEAQARGWGGGGRRRVSLRLRLTLWFLLGAAVLSIAAVGIIYVVQGHQVLQRLDDELRHRLEEYSSFVASSTDAAGLRTATEAYLSGEQSQVLRLGGIILLLVTDEDAIVSNSSDVRLEEIHMPERGSDGHGKPVSVATPVGRYRVVETPVLAGEREVGRVRMAAPMGTLLVSRDRVVALVALLLAIGTVGMGAGAWLVLGRALSPVKKITRAAASISREDLNRRINYVGRHDEIGELADTMDAMLERLEDAFKAQERFMSDVSHELRTPLTIAKGHIQVLDKMKVRDPLWFEASTRWCSKNWIV